MSVFLVSFRYEYMSDAIFNLIRFSKRSKTATTAAAAAVTSDKRYYYYTSLRMLHAYLEFQIVAIFVQQYSVKATTEFHFDASNIHAQAYLCTFQPLPVDRPISNGFIHWTHYLGNYQPDAQLNWMQTMTEAITHNMHYSSQSHSSSRPKKVRVTT